MRRRFLAASALLVALAAGLLTRPAEGERLAERVPGDVVLRGNPDALAPVRIVQAFPRLRFRRPLWIGHQPDGSGRMWVLEQDGRIWSFAGHRDVERKHLLLDISSQVYRRHNEEGLLGIAFHPDFARNRTLFLHYSANRPRRGVVSRFRMNRAKTAIDPKSERVVLQQRQPWGNHNGGGMRFGPDGYLYISFGDGGAANDPLGSGQDLTTWLGAMLRIDVDRGTPYAVPRDNPFVSRRGAKPEIWAYGLRNVWRFSFDRLTGTLWAGDVGQNAWEEISILTRGGNFGWNVREGHHPFQGGAKRADMIDPVISHDTSEARSITGGYVYRGARMPALQGAYLYADYATGWVWALRHDGEKVTQHLRIGRGGAVSSFGEDAAGEVYFTAFDGRIYTFAPSEQVADAAAFPRRLSETGLFTDMKRMVPHRALLPYSVNAPLWSAGAAKERFVMLPGTAKITVRKDGGYDFPRGTIFVKTFLAGPHRLETRLLVLRERGWEGYTYVWNDAQDEAHLIDGRAVKDLPPAVARHLASSRWTFPGRADCTSCHTPQAGHVLGFRPEQLDRVHVYGGHREHQLEVLARIGCFEGDPRTKPAWADWTDDAADRARRVRAYLAANCASCHLPGGTGNARIDLRHDTPLEKMGLLGEAPGQGTLGVRGAQLIKPGQPAKSLLYLRMLRTDALGMPNIAHDAVDRDAVEEIKRWIAGMR